jgi:hypothetical protein
MIDFEIPMNAEDEQVPQECKRKRIEHRRRMRNARVEWCRLFNIPVTKNFDKFFSWLAENYGLSPYMDSHGNIREGYDVVDEKKYTLFLLKYSQ